MHAQTFANMCNCVGVRMHICMNDLSIQNKYVLLIHSAVACEVIPHEDQPPRRFQDSGKSHEGLALSAWGQMNNQHLEQKWSCSLSDIRSLGRRVAAVQSSPWWACLKHSSAAEARIS